MQEEIWKPITGFETRYEISSYGRVRSLGMDLRWGTVTRHQPGRILVPESQYGSKDPTSYLQVRLCVDGKRMVKSIHRMVAEHFIPNPDNKPVVNHIDGDKTNNHVENLEWATQSENQVHAIKTGLKKTEPVVCIETGEVFPSIMFASKKYNCSRSSISMCILGKISSVKGLHFNYVNNPVSDEEKENNRTAQLQYFKTWNKKTKPKP